MEPQKPTNLDGNDTLSLHLLPFPQICTLQNSLLALNLFICTKWTSTQHSSLHSLPHKRQSISAMFSSDKISHYLNSIIPYRPSTCTPQFLHTHKTEHICHAQYSNYIAATHNITHSKCTSTCTTYPALPIPLPSTTKAYLCKWWQNGMHKM